MSKAVLVMDMPDKCEDCKCSYELDCETVCGITHERDNQIYSTLFERCPLRPLPEKPDYPPINEESYVAGWNACIDAIGGNNE